MLFNSIHFLIYFPIVVFLYFSLPQKYRNIMLLIASYYFYMTWNAKYIILIVISTLIDYFAGIQMEKTNDPFKRKLLLGASLASNLGLLFTFKYFNFASGSLEGLLSIFNIHKDLPILNFLLPVGISFYTFQTLSYTIDVYKKELKAEKNFITFALFVTFFPQLVAGPIERAKNLLHQFYEKHFFRYKDTVDGLKIMLWGFFKKIVIADRVSVVVNAVYNSPTDYTGLPLILATVLFAFQIYCDFSGYSDIAIGAAKIMGFKLMTNFKRPYFATSIADFWKRWHISLSTWFRDYLYIPLGGNRVSIPRWYLNLFVVFLVSGFWHGANWTFLAWGALHGLYLVAGIITTPVRKKIADLTRITKFPKLHYLYKITITFILADFAWIFFRANSMSDAIYIITHLFSGITLKTAGLNLGGIGMQGLIVSFAAILIMEIVHLIQENIPINTILSKKHIIFRWSAYLFLALIILLFGVFESKQFIYFQF